MMQGFQHHPATLAYQAGEHDDELIREAMHESKLPTLGRVLSILFSAKPQDLQVSLNDPPRRNDSINRALAILQQHANIEVKKGSDFNKLLVPLLEHVVKSRDRNNRKQVISIMNCLFQDDYLRMHLVDALVAIFQSTEVNSRVQLGWCVVVRDLLQQKVQASEPSNGTWDVALTPFVRCIPNLFDLISESSSKNMPTRLSVMAADCIILVSKYMGNNRSSSPENELKNSAPDDGLEQISTSVSNSSSVLRVFDHSELTSNEANTSGRTEFLAKEELLWEQLDTLLKFVFKLRKWNEDSRPLYARGLQQIAKFLENLVYFRDALQAQGGGERDLSVLMAVLSSYWNRYGVLMLVDSSIIRMDSKVILQQWVEGLQHSLQVQELEGDDEISTSSTRRVEEIRVFFLTCLTLFLGRLSTLETVDIMQESGPMLLQALFGQLHGKHEDVVDLAIAILRTLLFQSELVNVGTLRIDTVAPLLMDLLDERDSASKAVVGLIADYFAINPRAPEIERLFGILGSGNSGQRQNALGVLSELLNIISSSDHDMANAVRQSVAIHLLKRLGDTELANRVEVSQIFSKLDPEFVLPALVQHVYSRDEKVRSAASTSIVSILKGQTDPCAALCVLLDCTTNIIRNAQLPMHPGHIGVLSEEKSSPDMDRIMRLIPFWACEVQGWENIIDVVLRKMFSEPSNPVIPRFLSQISTQLLDNISAVFKHVFAFMAQQTQLSEDFMQKLNKEDGQLQERLNTFIFERLSPLLVLKVLPLAAFDKSCKELYGRSSENGKSFTCEDLCIARFLMDRTCGKYEAHEVRKLSAELLGRCIPNIILPLLKERLEYAVENQSIMEIKSYLFSLCNLVLLRGTSTLDLWMRQIERLLLQILLWPCSPTDTDTYNIQHGCIDCLALMIIAELSFSSTTDESAQEQHTPKHSAPKIIEEIKTVINKQIEVQPSVQEYVLLGVVSSIVGQHRAIPFLSNHSWQLAEVLKPKMAAPGIVIEEDLVARTSFRICMANVLIRATQKLAPKERPRFSTLVLPLIMDFVQVDSDSRVKSACLQLLFSVVHNFKEQIISYAVDLFNLSLGIMRSNASSEERLAATRLLASLLTSADNVMNEVAPYLSEALVTLESISRMDASSELRGLCEKLLECMTPAVP